MQIDMILSRERAAHARAGGFWLDKTLIDEFEHNLGRHPDVIAVIGYNSMTGRTEKLTNAELDQRVRRIASGFIRRGIERGDAFSAQLPNWWEMIALHLAALRIGAIFNPLMPIFRERELRFMLNLAQTKLIVVPELFRGVDHATMLEGLQRELPHLKHVLVIGEKRPASFEAMLAEEPSDLESQWRGRRTSADDVMQLLYTSGTTGEPKGVMHTSNTLMANLRQHIHIQGFNETDVTLMSSPVAHQTGFLYGIMNPIMTGGRVVLQDIWNPKEAIELIAKERVTFSIGSTPFLSDLLEAAKGQKEALQTLHTFVAAGAPIPRHLVRLAAEEFGVAVCSMWGMSENGPAAFTRPDDPPARSLETDGRAVPGMEMRVADPEGRSVPPDTEGRLMVRGAGMFVGYLKRPEWYATDSEGWFDTGDLARMDTDGYVRITGRSKDVIIRGGENIPVVEIENLIYQHPAVAEVAIAAMPDPRLDERGCAFAVLRPGQTLTLKDLAEYLLSRKCAKNYLPERLEIVDALPRTPTGKIQKFRLREIARDFAPSS
jgi:cyclohexanecarboxylate-CoA ligase